MNPEAMLAGYTSRQLATLLTLTIGLAAQTHPEELRAALAKVFDLKCIDEMTKRTMATASAAQRTALEAVHLLEQVNADLEAVEKRIDGLNYELERNAS